MATPCILPRFLCYWKWPVREQLIQEDRSIIIQPLISQDRIILPPLHIKLGLMKQFVKASDNHGAYSAYLSKAFPGLTSKRLKAGIFDGPQVRKLIKVRTFSLNMTKVEQDA